MGIDRRNHLTYQLLRELLLELLYEAMRQSGSPLALLRAENERPAQLKVRQRVLSEEVARDHRRRVVLHEAPLRGTGRQQGRAQRVEHAARRSKVRNAGADAHARPREEDHTLALVARDEFGHPIEQLLSRERRASEAETRAPSTMSAYFAPSIASDDAPPAECHERVTHATPAARARLGLCSTRVRVLRAT